MHVPRTGYGHLLCGAGIARATARPSRNGIQNMLEVRVRRNSQLMFCAMAGYDGMRLQSIATFRRGPGLHACRAYGRFAERDWISRLI